MIEIENVWKTYPTAKGDLHALQGVSLEARGGEMVVVNGPSGAGKTTLLLVTGGMLRPTSGGVRVAGRELYSMSHAERSVFRGEKIGFVFQMFHLVPYLDVLDNVLVAACVGAGARDRARDLLESLGISHRATHRPAALSAGERQRVAIARALVNRPSVILADEPTGNLDPESANAVLEALGDYRKDGGTVIIVSHGALAAAHADRTLRLEAGRFTE
ncbi:MAG TPA: ABC transporter ATP-binding protein [Planctomycetota bacterium]|nr:ABC transporter ATP-binding protein [Planctomycetota bacterium]